jgi:hypothetical protein
LTVGEPEPVEKDVVVGYYVIPDDVEDAHAAWGLFPHLHRAQRGEVILGTEVRRGGTGSGDREQG